MARVRQIVLRPRRYALIALVALCFTTLVAQTPMYRQVSLWAQDAVHEITAQRVRFEDVLVIDVDELTMSELESSVGAWPYPRRLYADVVDYLFREGARAVVFDMLLIEQRDGDDELSRALSRHRNVWLAARGQDLPLVRQSGYFDQLQHYAWPVAENVPVSSWSDFLLPTPALGTQAGAAVISVSPDEDGVLRAIAPIHRAYGVSLPAMSIAVGHPFVEAPTVSLSSGVLSVGANRWPLDAQGRIVMQIPRNRDFLRVVSFSQVLAASAGTDQAAIDSSQIRGRTVFLGSSAAILGDYARLPVHGRTAGLGILALSYAALANGLVLKPPHWLLNVVLVLLAAALPLLYTNRRVFSEIMITLCAATGIALAFTVHVAAFGWFAQLSDVTFAVLLGLTVWLVQLALRFRTLYDERQMLWMAKLAADEANELKSRFLAHMTHELRTPLSAILGYNKLLAEPEQSQEQRTQFTDVVQRNGEHLLALINNLLDQAKIEAGQMSVELEPTTVRSLLAEFAKTLSPLADEKDIELNVTCDEQVPQVLSLDPLRLTQILFNLTGNAIKFTSRGAVSVSVNWRDGELLVDVSDTGPGMSEQALARVFDAFAQADSTIVRKHGGTGLGLTISLNLARQMGGDLNARSRLGEGTVFSARVAAPAVEMQPAATEPASVSKDSGLTGTVLLVDDTADIRELVGLHLRRLGLAVLTANDGRQGVRMALSERPDLVLMDVEMPQLDGRQATRTLREEGFENVVLALTAHQDATQLQSLLDAGCDGIVSKPVTREELAQAMREHLGEGRGAWQGHAC